MLKYFLTFFLFLSSPASSQEAPQQSPAQTETEKKQPPYSTSSQETPQQSSFQIKTEKKQPPFFEDEFLKNEKNGSRFYQEFLKMIFLLILIIGLLFLVLLILKKFLYNREQKMNIQNRIKILEQRAISSKSTLYLLKVDDISLLIAESPAGVHSLTELHSSHRSFEEVLDKKRESS